MSMSMFVSLIHTWFGITNNHPEVLFNIADGI